MSNQQIIREQIASAGSGFVSVYFTKLNGEERQMTFNPRHFGEVKGTGHAIKDPDALVNIVRCMDIKNGWRSFDCRRVFRMRVNGEVLDLTPED